MFLMNAWHETTHTKKEVEFDPDGNPKRKQQPPVSFYVAPPLFSHITTQNLVSSLWTQQSVFVLATTMNQILNSSFLGLELPSLGARHAVMKLPTGRRKRPAPSLIDCHRDSLLCISNVEKISSMLSTTKDDDTLSTVSSDDDSFVSTSGCLVTFAEPLVTAVYERPVTTMAERFRLFYTDLEYREFRRDYYQSQRKRTCLVHFASELVSEVHEYPCQGIKDDLFYNETDLQR